MVSPFSAIARASCKETGRSSTVKLSPPEVLGSPSEKRISWNHEIADIRWSSTAASPLQNRVGSSSPLLNCVSKESGSAVRRSLIAEHVPYHVLSELVVPILCFLDHIVAIQHVEGGPFLCVRPLRGGPLSHVDKYDGRFECAQVNRYPESLSSTVPAQSPRLDSK